ncbi:MAG: helix-turn-helix domain-containing protein [Oscillospiraceae bacterium]|nr:helix-turn-helix domain-containing protein [Oscillospiraceae bacterium]
MVILIADDDRLARFSLKSVLCDILDENPMIIEVSNGKRLVEQCRLHQPDVAFVDISMPHLDGLSAIAQCMESDSDTQFVIISGYSDFSYARKGISLQVADYLLKPIEEAELKSVMDRLMVRLYDNRRNLNLNFNVRAGDCFRLWEEVGYCPQEDPCADMPGQYYAFRFYLDSPPAPESYREGYLTLTQGLQDFGKRLLSSRVPYMIWEPKDSGLVFIVRCEERTFDSLRGKLEKLCASVANSRLALSCVCARGMDLWTLFNAMKENAGREEYRFGLTYGKITSFDQTLFTEREQALLKTISELVDAYQEADESLYNKALKALQQYPNSTIRSIQTNTLVHLLSVCMNGRFSWPGTLQGLCRQLERHRSQIFVGGVCMETDKFAKIVKYVDQHYMEDISVVQMAEKMDLTPNYFSKIFRDRMGKTFSAYLTEVRINQAKRILLMRKNVRVKDVALMVGYFSPRHFTNVFKKMTGCYPGDFRKQHQGGDTEKPD